MNAVAEPRLGIEQFEAGDVDAEHFDHEAHVYMGWLYVQAFDLADAVARFDSALRRLTARLGVPGKYHATITWLFLVLINERAAPNETWEEFRSRNESLIRDSKTTLQRYYSDTLLFSDEARRHFVLPDKLAV